MSLIQAEKSFLGRYELQKKLAVGGMAEVYLAQVSGVGGFQKQVVVKRILPQLAESEEVFRMFLDEARIAATLQHQNLVQTYDCCQEGGECFMAMEYLDGTDLKTLGKGLADKQSILPMEHALRIVSSIAGGLHYAHEKRGQDGKALGIVHRDVTPCNVFLTRDGGIKLVEFSIAKTLGRKGVTVAGSTKGRSVYKSPEQCQSVDVVVDRRSDIYSLGVILYELTTGNRFHQSVKEYQSLRPMDYPEALEVIVLRCLEKNPESRYSTARELQVAIETFARDRQLVGSALGFSDFLEPFLEEAQNPSQDSSPYSQEVDFPLKASDVAVPTHIRAKGSSATMLAVATEKANSKLCADRYPSFLKSIPNIPTLAPRFSIQQGPVSLESLASKPLELSRPLEVAPCFSDEEHQTPRELDSLDRGESMTALVPSDVLRRIRAQERLLVAQERVAAKEKTAEEKRTRRTVNTVARFARGTTASQPLDLPLPQDAARCFSDENHQPSTDVAVLVSPNVVVRGTANLEEPIALIADAQGTVAGAIDADLQETAAKVELLDLDGGSIDIEVDDLSFCDEADQEDQDFAEGLEGIAEVVLVESLLDEDSECEEFVDVSFDDASLDDASLDDEALDELLFGVRTLADLNDLSGQQKRSGLLSVVARDSGCQDVLIVEDSNVFMQSRETEFPNQVGAQNISLKAEVFTEEPYQLRQSRSFNRGRNLLGVGLLTLSAVGVALALL